MMERKRPRGRKGMTMVDEIENGSSNTEIKRRTAGWEA